MLVFLNGRLVPEEQAVVSTFDRGFLYGDGVFETIPIHNGHPFRWRSHLERFERGAQFLKIKLPFSSDELHRAAHELLQQNGLKHGVVRIVLSRGIGPRGYAPKAARQPTCVMSSHERDSIGSASCRLVSSGYLANTDDPLLRHKTCNKLPQVLARAAAEEAEADEALLLNARGEAVTASSANLFWVTQNIVCTPPVEAGALPGITRAIVRELCHNHGLPCQEGMIPARELANAEGVFLTLSSKGIVPVTRFDGAKIRLPKQISLLKEAYAAVVSKECGAA